MKNSLKMWAVVKNISLNFSVLWLFELEFEKLKDGFIYWCMRELFEVLSLKFIIGTNVATTKGYFCPSLAMFFTQFGFQF